MPLLVTSAAGTNGNGYGALLAFDFDGTKLGAFSDDDRIVDPRGLGVDRAEGLLFVNSGANRILALDRHGKVVRDTGSIEGLILAVAISDQMVAITSDCATRVLSWLLRPASMPLASISFRPESGHFHAVLPLGATGRCSLLPVSARTTRATTSSSYSLRTNALGGLGL